MNFLRLLIVLSAMLLASMAAQAETHEDRFKRINAVAHPAFPAGTQGYELFWVEPGDPGSAVETLSSVLAAAKRQRARWVVASDDAEALTSTLMAVFARAEGSRRIRTQIVLVSPLSENAALEDAAKRVGAALEFRVLPPPPQA